MISLLLYASTTYRYGLNIHIGTHVIHLSGKLSFNDILIINKSQHCPFVIRRRESPIAIEGFKHSLIKRLCL